MSDYENKPNTGALFKNERKETENHPDYNGSLNVDGKDYWLSAWINKSQAGKTYMKVSVKVKEPRSQSNPIPSAPPAGGMRDDDPQDIPF